MRVEAKVYMSHTDLERIQAAAKKTGETISGFMRRVVLAETDRVGVPYFRSLEGQLDMTDILQEKGGNR